MAAAEYGAEFRRDIEAFVSREAIGAVVVPTPTVDSDEPPADREPCGAMPQRRRNTALAMARSEVARTIAGLAGADAIAAEAVQYRALDRAVA